VNRRRFPDFFLPSDKNFIWISVRSSIPPKKPHAFPAAPGDHVHPPSQDGAQLQEMIMQHDQRSFAQALKASVSSLSPYIATGVL